MKALPLLAAIVFCTGCDLKSKSTVEVAEETEPATPRPKAAPPAPKPGDWLLEGKRNPLDGRKLAEPKSGGAPRPGASPTPEPKQGDWLLKGYKNPLEQKPR